ncbi:MAG: alpha/beta fold hydrolase [Candidatus Dadabacteria bacterium]|nr:MAG: alpha/beta fold hydrolase [Candidatus Dadabacteria bacterium]
MALSERPLSVPVEGGVVLEARVREAGRKPRGIAVVAPPHPLYGGTMSNPVVVAAARALAELELRVLRFNWRGTGRSGGTASGDLEQAAADYSAVVEALIETIGGDQQAAGALVLAGYSFGALAAARVAGSRESARCLLVAPPVGLVGPEPFRALAPRAAVVVGEADQFAPIGECRRAFEAAGGERLRILAGADHFFSSVGAERLQAELAAAAGLLLEGTRPGSAAQDRGRPQSGKPSE